MAGLPLKSGADFYNLEAARLRLHNLGADPTEVGAGLIYFNTSTGMNTSQKARIYTGNAWKTIAFSEDLDVASNADFLALKDRVDLLSGDVDTDAIINNMREVSEFLEGFAEDASLMDYLNTELGKKLDKTGGTITFSGLYGLTLARTSNNTNLIHFTGGDKDFGFLGFAGVGNPIYADYKGVSYALLHEGNYTEYVLPKMGGTIGNRLAISSEADAKIIFNETGTDVKYQQIAFQDHGVEYGRLGTYGDDQLKWTGKTLLHQGNFSDYALPLTGGTINSNTYDILVLNTSYAHGDARINLKVNGESKSLFGWSSAFGTMIYNATNGYVLGIKDDGTPHYNDNTILHSGNVGEYALKFVKNGSFDISEIPALNTFGLWHGAGAYVRVGTSDLYNFTLRVRLGILEAQINGGTAEDAWKTIAFTDSTVAAAQRLVHTNGANIIYNSGSTFYVGDTVYINVPTHILGKEIALRYGASAATGLILNQSGNVTIGSQDYAGTDVKLYVDGAISVLGDGTTNGGLAVNWGTESQYHLGSNASNDFYISSSNNATFRIVVGGADRMRINSSGNVGIGTTDPQAKLEVAGASKILGTLSVNTAFDINRNAENGDIFNSERAAFEIETLANIVRFRTFNPNVNNALTFYGSQGNVGIGKIAYTHKLEVDGNVHISGNLIVEGEISGGGRAEEGGTIGGGGAAEKVTATIEVGLKFKEISHTLGDNVIVQVYEWNANGQTWDMVLTDVETTTNLVTVRFGNETDVPHKVVII